MLCPSPNRPSKKWPLHCKYKWNTAICRQCVDPHGLPRRFGFSGCHVDGHNGFLQATFDPNTTHPGLINSYTYFFNSILISVWYILNVVSKHILWRYYIFHIPTLVFFLHSIGLPMVFSLLWTRRAKHWVRHTIRFKLTTILLGQGMDVSFLARGAHIVELFANMNITLTPY